MNLANIKTETMLLRQLIDTVNAYGQPFHVLYFHSYNIAGHCLLIAGEIDQARDMFSRSEQLTQSLQLLRSPSSTSAASWYLQKFCGNTL